MVQFILGAMTVVGGVYVVNYLFDDSLDARTLLYARLGALAFSVGVVGLGAIVFQSM